MPLILRHIDGLGSDQFSAFDNGRYLGRVYRTMQGDWIWGVNLLAAGKKSISGRSATRASAIAELKTAAEASRTLAGTTENVVDIVGASAFGRADFQAFKKQAHQRWNLTVNLGKFHPILPNAKTRT